MDVVLLHNPNAGNGSFPGVDLTRMVHNAGFAVRYHEVHHALKTPAVMNEGEFVIAAGGDGTIRKVALALREMGRPLAPLPLGTANNISRSLGLHAPTTEIVHGWRHARRRRFDLGVASGPWRKRSFFEGGGIGLVSRTMAVLAVIDETLGRDFTTAGDKLRQSGLNHRRRSRCRRTGVGAAAVGPSVTPDHSRTGMRKDRTTDHSTACRFSLGTSLPRGRLRVGLARTPGC